MIYIRKGELRRRVKDLLRFGLTEYQAKVFVGVLVLSRAKATELVSLVDIPKARVYQILDELLEMGAIRKMPGRPITYIALNPTVALTNVLDWRREKTEKELFLLEEMKTDLAPGLNKLFQTGKPQKKGNFLEVIPAGEISDIETKKMYKSAEGEIRILTGVFEYLPRVLSELISASNKGVKIKVLLLDPEGLDKRGGEIQREVIEFLKGVNAEIWFSKDMPLRAGISDKTAVFSVDEKKSIQFLKEVAITSDMTFLRALTQYFDLMWEKAKL